MTPLIRLFGFPYEQCAGRSSRDVPIIGAMSHDAPVDWFLLVLCTKNGAHMATSGSQARGEILSAK